MESWGKFRIEAKPLRIKKIGLRYINRVGRRVADEKPGVWLRQTNLIPSALLNSAEGFSYRLEARQDANDVVIATVAHAKGPNMGPHGSLILDLDRIAEREVGIEDAALSDALEQLHEELWSIFLAAKNENYDKLLNGEISNVTG
jgi:uncharacterized protein (TIGR04255 family)